MDIEQDLASRASSLEQPLPPWTPGLDRSPRPSSCRRLIRGASVVAAVIVVGLLTRLLPDRSSESGTPRADSVAPSDPPEASSSASSTGLATAPPTTGPTATEVAAGAWVGGRTGPTDNTLYLVVLDAPRQSSDEPCASTLDVVVAESSSTVSIEIVSSRVLPADGATCPDVAIDRGIQVVLDAPLEERELVVAGVPRAVFDGTSLVSPGWLPTGFALTAERPGYPSPETSSYWQRSWIAPRQANSETGCVPGSGGLSLTEGPSDVVGTFPAQAGEASDAPIDVRGRPGTVTLLDHGGAMIAWTDGDRGFVVMPFLPCAGDEPLDFDATVRFARSLAS